MARVLVVDDDWDIRELLASHYILEPWKAGVVEATLRVALRESEARNLLNGTKYQHSDDVELNSESFAKKKDPNKGNKGTK